MPKTGTDTDTEMQIPTDNGLEPVTFVDPTGHRHGVDDFGGDGVVLTGTAHTNWNFKTYTWDDLRDSGHTAYIGDTEADIDDIRRSIPGTDQDA